MVQQPMQAANAFLKPIPVSGSAFVCGKVNYLKPNCLTTDLKLTTSLHWIRPMALYFSPLFLKRTSRSLVKKVQEKAISS